MSEYVRSVKVLVEVDTNKRTYTLDMDDVALGDVETVVREFLEGVAS